MRLQMVADWCSYKLTVGSFVNYKFVCLGFRGFWVILYSYSLYIKQTLSIGIHWLKQDGQRLIHALCI